MAQQRDSSVTTIEENYYRQAFEKIITGYVHDEEVRKYITDITIRFLMLLRYLPDNLKTRLVFYIFDNLSVDTVLNLLSAYVDKVRERYSKMTMVASRIAPRRNNEDAFSTWIMEMVKPLVEQHLNQIITQRLGVNTGASIDSSQPTQSSTGGLSGEDLKKIREIILGGGGESKEGGG